MRIASFFVFQRATDAAERTAGPDGTDEAVDAALGLLPDFRSRGLRMEFAVREVLELVGPERAAGILLVHCRGDAARRVHKVLRVLVRHRRDQAHLGAVRPQRLDLGAALVIRHDDNAAITQRAANQRQADARVARRALDDGAAGLQITAGFGGPDHAERGAVLDRAARIHEFGFAEYFAAGLIRQAIQPDQRRVADAVDDG